MSFAPSVTARKLRTSEAEEQTQQDGQARSTVWTKRDTPGSKGLPSPRVSEVIVQPLLKPLENSKTCIQSQKQKGNLHPSFPYHLGGTGTSFHTKVVRGGKLRAEMTVTTYVVSAQRNPVCSSQQAYQSGMWQHSCKPGPVTARDLPEAPEEATQDSWAHEKSSNPGDAGAPFWTSRIHTV